MIKQLITLGPIASTNANAPWTACSWHLQLFTDCVIHLDRCLNTFVNILVYDTKQKENKTKQNNKKLMYFIFLFDR